MAPGTAPRVPSPSLILARHDRSLLVEQIVVPATPKPRELSFAGAVWEVRLTRAPGVESGSERFLACARVLSGRPEQVSVALEFVFPRWSKSVYSCLPGALYAGNRQPCLPVAYPPVIAGRPEARPDAPPYLTDVPRLDDGPGDSRVQLLVGDLATPAAGFFFPTEKLGLWIFTAQGTNLGDTGIELEESPSRDRATLRLRSPGVRERHRYFITTRTTVPSPDRGASLKPGDSLALEARAHAFACDRIPTLFERFVPLREREAGPPRPVAELPFSAARDLLRRKLDEENWHEELGIHCTTTKGPTTPEWQMGWVGGMMMPAALAATGLPEEIARCARSLDFAFGPALAPSGFFRGMLQEGAWKDDSFGKAPSGQKWHLLRKSADGLYFACKHLDYLQVRHPDTLLPSSWLAGAGRVADAFVALWRRERQLGQFVDEDSGALLVGGSAGPAIAAAALALAARVLARPDYFAIAAEIARHYAERFTARGLSTGGPGEILQCPDSESCFGLLESYVVLAEESGDPRWTALAREQAAQCASWVMSYDFRFPVASTFGALALGTRGTVFANVQNKHSAPGVCTLSGDSLLKLFRLTGETVWLDLLRDIARALPAFVSRPERPIRAPGGFLRPGWICERVNTSDWLEPVGEIFNGSCSWCETALLLTTVELPSLYVQPDTALLRVFDQVEAELLQAGEDFVRLRLHNHTDHDAELTIFCESSARARVTPLHTLWRQELAKAFVHAHGTVELTVRALDACAAREPILGSA